MRGALKRIYLRLIQRPYPALSVSEDSSYRYKDSKKGSHFYSSLAVGTSLAAYLTYKLFYSPNRNVLLEQAENATDIKAGVFRSDLPNYTYKQVAEHAEKGNRIWVTFKQGVYDITEFVEAHPGGDQILQAAGSSLEPFWNLYAIHHSPFVFEMLESLRIGNLTEETKKKTEHVDPYANDPVRHKALIPASKKPFNAEVAPPLLVENFITPKNHLPVPEIDPKTYELKIEVEGTKKSLGLTLDELKKFPKHTITATIMCAGNRRSEMVEVKPVKGLNWGPAAVGNANWSGAKLRDVLKAVGIDENSNYEHVQFEGVDTDPTGKSYGASIPFWKAVDKKADVLLAYEMNGEPIPRDHGFPVRVVVPGVVGARNVKWLGKIIVSKKESDSHWQQNDYKGFSPSVDWDNVDFTKAPAIQELPVTSAICKPTANQTVTVKDGCITVYGYAWSGGGQKIVRVDVTIDGGQTWHVANFDHQDSSKPPQHWAWTLWSAKIPVPSNTSEVEIWAKAVDSSYNTQPESFNNIWNLRGVLSNAYHRVPIKLIWK